MKVTRLYIFAIALMSFLCSLPVLAQKNARAVQTAMAEVIHKHSTRADTVAIEISQKFSKDAAMQTALARAYFRNNEREKTRTYLKKALAIDDKYSPAYILTGEMYGEWDVDSACLWYDKAIEADSLNTEAYVKYANVMARNDMDKAIAKLEALRMIVPSYPVDVEIAKIYTKKGNDAEAAKALANVDPTTLDMNQLISYVQNCFWSNDDARCMELCNVGMDRFPANKGFNRVFSWCAARTGNYKSGLENCKIWFEATAKDSLNSIDYYSLGTCYLGMGNEDEAFTTWAEINNVDDYFARQMDGQIVNAVNAKVSSLKEKGMFDDAAKLYRKFDNAYPSKNDPAYRLYTLSEIYKEEQKDLEGEFKKPVLEKMFAVYDELEQKYPDWSNLHYVLYTHARYTYAYLDPQNTQCLAEPHYRKLYDYIGMKEDPSDQMKNMQVEACQYLASISYFTRHDLKTARVWWNKILEIDPENEMAAKALATIKK